MGGIFVNHHMVGMVDFRKKDRTWRFLFFMAFFYGKF